MVTSVTDGFGEPRYRPEMEKDRLMRPSSAEAFVLPVAFCLIAAQAWAVTPASPDTPANITVEQVKQALAGAKSGRGADFAGRSLSRLDLSDLDFSGADLAGANLFAAKLAKANFSHANLTGANLNLSWLIGANFTDANLTDASLVAPVVAQGLDAAKGEIPTFKGANFTGARVQARFTGGSLEGAKFDGADISAHLNNQSMGLMHTEMGSAKVEGADFSKANMGHVDLSFADLKGANFSGADLSRADLTGADCSNADFTNANLDGAEMDGTKLDGAKGLGAARNIDKARKLKRP